MGGSLPDPVDSEPCAPASPVVARWSWVLVMVTAACLSYAAHSWAWSWLAGCVWGVAVTNLWITVRSEDGDG